MMEDVTTTAAKGRSLSKSQEYRRICKPIMEKRRRHRINKLLVELKGLILEALKRDSSSHSKLEKADILEMTVKYLQNLQRQQLAAALTVDPTVLTRYRSGFGECAAEVSRYLTSVDGVDGSLKVRLVSHLNSCVQAIPQQALQQLQPFQLQVTSAATAAAAATQQFSTGKPGFNQGYLSTNLLPQSSTGLPHMLHARSSGMLPKLPQAIVRPIAVTIPEKRVPSGGTSAGSDFRDGSALCGGGSTKDGMSCGGSSAGEARSACCSPASSVSSCGSCSLSGSSEMGSVKDHDEDPSPDIQEKFRMEDDVEDEDEMWRPW